MLFLRPILDIFCESPEAAKSPYVRAEQAYIINSGKDKVWKIDMTADIDSILDKVRKICADIEVFVSYANHDRDKIQPLIEALVRKDFSVWNPEDNLKLGDNSAFKNGKPRGCRQIFMYGREIGE